MNSVCVPLPSRAGWNVCLVVLPDSTWSGKLEREPYACSLSFHSISRRNLLLLRKVFRILFLAGEYSTQKRYFLPFMFWDLWLLGSLVLERLAFDYT